MMRKNWCTYWILFGLQAICIHGVLLTISSSPGLHRMAVWGSVCIVLHRCIQKEVRRARIRGFEPLQELVLPASASIATLALGFHDSELSIKPLGRSRIMDMFRATSKKLVACSGEEAKIFDLGQDASIGELKGAYEDLVRQGHKVRLYGGSRHAATILNFLALYQPQNVVCAIVDSPFDDVETPLQALLGVGKIPLLRSLVSITITIVVTCFKKILFPVMKKIPITAHIIAELEAVNFQHSIYSVHPQDVVGRITAIPLLFTSYEEDHWVPSQCSRRLIQRLHAAGNRSVFYVPVIGTGHGPTQPAQEDDESDQSKLDALINIVERFIINPLSNPIPSSPAQ